MKVGMEYCFHDRPFMAFLFGVLSLSSRVDTVNPGRSVVQYIRFLEGSLWGSAGLISLEIDFFSENVLIVTVTYKAGHDISGKIRQNIVDSWNPAWGSIFHEKQCDRTERVDR